MAAALMTGIGRNSECLLPAPMPAYQCNKGEPEDLVAIFNADGTASALRLIGSSIYRKSPARICVDKFGLPGDRISDVLLCRVVVLLQLDQAAQQHG